jgi:hypothetical protein
MSSETVHRFVPYLTPADWLAFVLPAFLSFLFLGIACALFFRRRKAVAGFAFLTFGLLMLGWWGQGLPRLNTVEFRGAFVKIAGPLTEVRLTLSRDNCVLESEESFLLLSQGKQTSLPRNGRWRWGEIWVDARYLANEFAGRSQKRGPDGRLLALQEPADIQSHHRNKDQSNHN